MLRRFLLAVVVATGPLAAGAQSLSAPVPGQTRALSSQPYQQTISINPLGLPFGVFSAEFEHVASSGFTVGVGGTYASDLYGDAEDNSDARDAWVEGKLMYYPGEVPLRGFSLGLTAGYHNARNDGGGIFDPGGVVRSEGAPTVGVLLDYNWLIGPRRRFLVGLGIGARRVVKHVGSDSPLSQVYPDGRLQTGFAF